MKFNLFDDHREAFLPLTYTRPVADLRIGITTIREKWENMLDGAAGFITEDYLQELFRPCTSNLFINGRIIPDPELCEKIMSLQPGEGIAYQGKVIAGVNTGDSGKPETRAWQLTETQRVPLAIENLFDLFQKNKEVLIRDFSFSDQENQGKAHHSTLIGDDIFIHPTARVQGAVINSETGPVYIGPGAEVMEGALIRGPFALLDHSVVKMGAKIYGATTIGPHSKVGGELSNVVFQGYSNKAHDGFLGNSVIGEWCNLGADTNSSNLKNNYGSVKVWNFMAEKLTDSGLTFCGLLMGDHSKSAINTQFNTGTVVGVASNVFDSGFPPKFIPSFSWGGAQGFEVFDFDKAMEVADRMMNRRGLNLTDAHIAVMRHIYDQSAKYRS